MKLGPFSKEKFIRMIQLNTRHTMEISIRKKDEIAILKLEGKLDTQTAPDAEKALAELINEGSFKILVNFSSLDYVSSVGLRVLLATAKRLKTNQGEMRLCALNEVVRDVFDISGFSKIFKISATEPEALDDF